MRHMAVLAVFVASVSFGLYNVEGSNRQFGIAGDTVGVLTPGVSREVDLELSNPNDVPLRVQDVDLTVEPGSVRGCDGPTNLKVTRSFDGPVTVPPKHTATLSELGVAVRRWPRVTMPDLPVNQDACRNTSFTIRYSGVADG